MFHKKLLMHWYRLRQRFWVSLGVDVLLILGVFWVIHTWQTRDLPEQTPISDSVLVSLDNSGMQPLISPGKSGVIYFFAPWCVICESSIGNLDDLLENGTVEWATAVALDYQTVEEVRVFKSETGIDMPIVLGTRETALEWSIKAFPTYFVIDENGKIQSQSVGYSTWLGLRLRVANWL